MKPVGNYKCYEVEMKKLGKMTTSLGIATLLLTSLGSVAPASAAVVDITAEDEALMKSTFSKYSVPDDVQDKLIAELADGEVWDNASAEAEPTAVEDWSTREEAVTVERFADGSITILSKEKPALPSKDQAGTDAVITGCSVAGGSGYSVKKDCTIANNWVNVTIGFVANYSNINGADDTIDALGNVTQQCFAGNCTRPEYTITKLKEDANGPASAQIQSTYTAGDATSSEYWVKLEVGNDTAQASNS